MRRVHNKRQRRWSRQFVVVNPAYKMLELSTDTVDEPFDGALGCVSIAPLELDQ